MSSALESARDQILKIVRETTVRLVTGHPFTSGNDALRGAIPLEAQAEAGVWRAFDLITRPGTGPQDDGMCGITSLRFRKQFAIRITYPGSWGGDREALIRVMDDDSELMITRLRNPNNWATPGSGIETLNIGLDDQVPTTTPIGGTDADSPGYIRTIPLTLLYGT